MSTPIPYHNSSNTVQIIQELIRTDIKEKKEILEEIDVIAGDFLYRFTEKIKRKSNNINLVIAKDMIENGEKWQKEVIGMLKGVTEIEGTKIEIKRQDISNSGLNKNNVDSRYNALLTVTIGESDQKREVTIKFFSWPPLLFKPELCDQVIKNIKEQKISRKKILDNNNYDQEQICDQDCFDENFLEYLRLIEYIVKNDSEINNDIEQAVLGISNNLTKAKKVYKKSDHDKSEATENVSINATENLNLCRLYVKEEIANFFRFDNLYYPVENSKVSKIIQQVLIRIASYIEKNQESIAEKFPKLKADIPRMIKFKAGSYEAVENVKKETEKKENGKSEKYYTDSNGGSEFFRKSSELSSSPPKNIGTAKNEENKEKSIDDEKIFLKVAMNKTLEHMKKAQNPAIKIKIAERIMDAVVATIAQNGLDEDEEEYENIENGLKSGRK